MGRRAGSLKKGVLEKLPRGVTFLRDGRAKPFCVRHRDLPREFFEFAESAINRKRELVELERAEGVAALEYSRADHAELLAARAILPAGVSLTDAARFWVAHHPGEFLTVSEAVLRFIASKRSVSARPEGKLTPHVRDLHNRVGAFGLAFGERSLADIGSGEVMEWLGSLGQAPRSVANFRVALTNFFNFAVRRRWLSRSPMAEISREDLPVVRGGRKNPLSIMEARALMGVVQLRAPQFLPHFALRLYLGFRSAEAVRFRWDWIQRDLGRVYIPGWFYDGSDPHGERGSKTGDAWAIYDVPPTFWAWLDGTARLTGQPTPSSGQVPAPWAELWRESIRPAWLAATGRKIWPSNACRDTFCTLHISAYKDPQKTALVLKHSNAQTLHRSYLGTLIPQQDAITFFEQIF